MKKILISLFIITLLVLMACQKSVEVKKDDSAEKLKQLYNQSTKKEKLQINFSDEDADAPFEETPVHKCAIFKKDEGAELCGMRLQASNFASNDIHTTCNQVFREDRLPLSFVSIRVLEYKSNSETKEKFALDRGTYRGDISPRNKLIFIREKPRLAEFYKGKKIVRISDTNNACKQFDKLVDLAFARS